MMRTAETLECDNVPERNAWGLDGVQQDGTPTPVCNQCRAESGLAAPARDGRAAPLFLRGRHARRLSSAEAVGCPGSRRPGVCCDPAGAPHAGARGAVLGAARADRCVESGRGHCRTTSRRAAQQGSWLVRAPTFMGWPPRACAGISERSSASRTSGPPGTPRHAYRAMQAGPRRVCQPPERESRAVPSLRRRPGLRPGVAWGIAGDDGGGQVQWKSTTYRE